ncbi:MAG: hypothetical protein KAS46_05310 [Candidatus Aureabacteria bacterium]|nr:hypothetical protein [Candidatus Auribacterota bacterium]
MKAKKYRSFSFFKFFFFSFVIFLLVVFILIITAPALISSAQGKSLLLKIINNNFSGKISIESINLNWRGEQSIKGFSLTDDNNSVTFKAFETQLSLLDILLKKRLDFGTTRLEDLYAEISLYETKDLGIKAREAAKKAQPEKTDLIAWFLPRTFSGNMEIINANLVILKPGIDPAEFNNVANLSTNLHVEITEDIIKLSKAAKIKCGISPALYKIIIENNNLNNRLLLAEPASLETNIETFEILVKKPVKDFLSLLNSAKFDIKMRTQKFSLTDTLYKQAIILAPLTISASSKNASLKTILNADAVFTCTDHSGNILDKGDISVQSEISDIVKPDGSFNKNGLLLKLNTSFKGLSTARLDKLFNTNNTITAVMGKTLDLKASAELKGLKGPVDIYFKTSNSTAAISALINKDSVLLRDDVKAELTVTPALGALVLKNINPILITAVSSSRPIYITINQNGFYVPLNKASFSDIKIEEAVIDLGELTLENGGLLNPLVAFLKSTYGRQMTASFTPLKASLAEGIAQYSRMDTVIANSFHIATWGTIDIENDTLDVTLGLTSDTLDKAFDIEGLSEDYILKIPVRGSTENPKVNWAEAAKQIGTLVLKRKIDEKLPGLGTAIEELFNKPDGKD